MLTLLAIYVLLVVPALLGTLRVVNGVLDLYERLRALRRQATVRLPPESR